MPATAHEPRILACPRLSTGRGPALFTDVHGQMHDLLREKTLRCKEAAADVRLGGVSAWQVRRMIQTGELFPVLRINARRLLVYDCALTDWRARCELAQGPRPETSKPAAPHKPRGLARRRPAGVDQSTFAA